MAIQYKLNSDLRAIIEFIQTTLSYIDLIDLLNWCESENYLKAYYDNFHLIQAFVIQHNEKY